MIYIFDIDGTIADLRHRLCYIECEPKMWREFFGECGDDKPIRDMIYLAQVLHDSGHVILLVSGRSDEVRSKTEKWLREQLVPYKGLYMRKAGDHRADNIVKGELIDTLCKEWRKDSIQGIFEDRDQVVKMYREKGFRVLQVADGNF